MKTRVVFPGLSLFLTAVLGILSLPSSVQAQILSPSGTEVRYSYQATVEFPLEAAQQTDEARAEFHASHIFGLFHSPSLVERFGISYEQSGGLGGPRTQMKIEILNSKVKHGKVHVTYKNSGRMILHRQAAHTLLQQGYLDLPMPVNPYEIYDQNCTDEHYQSFGDFWYFYDPFRAGCEYLSEEPNAKMVRMSLRPTDFKKLEKTPQLPALRGDNGNGDLFSIYVIHGYAENRLKDDVGRINYKEFRTYLLQNGFKAHNVGTRTNPQVNYSKELVLENGKKIQLLLKHALVETSISSKSKAFALFFKEAVENADVVIYGGHSGLGGNLDIPSLELKAGAFQFKSNKKQLFFFESCSSYSYYLEHFKAEKTKSKIDILTNGLSSYFHTSNAVVTTLLDHLLTPRLVDPSWHDVLFDMENVLEGETYLLNVGGI